MKYDLSQAVENLKTREFFIMMFLKYTKMTSNVGSKNPEKYSGITKISSKREAY